MTRCPCCAGATTAPLYTVRGHHYMACETCGSAWLDPLPPDETAELYGERYFVGGEDRGGYVDYDADAALHRRNAAARLRLVIAALTPGARGHVVDVGCASGYALDAYRDAGFVPHGVDVSPWARAQATARGHDVHGSVDAALGAAAADLRAVSFFQVLEHLPDPDAALGRAGNA